MVSGSSMRRSTFLQSKCRCSGTNTGNMIRPSRGSETSCNRWRARFSSQDGHPLKRQTDLMFVLPTSLAAARDHGDVRREDFQIAHCAMPKRVVRDEVGRAIRDYER